MTKYMYKGAFTVDVIAQKEIVFQNGNFYELDEKNDRVKTLVKLQKLTPVETVTKQEQKGKK